MKHKIHNHGFIELIDHMGDDLRVINAARQSYDRSSELLGVADEGLINYMMKNSHGVPFEHVVFTFKVKLPIFIAREWVKHRISSMSEISGRYTELKPEFYLPGRHMIRKQVGKPGNYHFEEIEDDAIALDGLDIMEGAYRHVWKAYQELLSLGFAKEVARDVLPVGIYTEFIWTVNLRSLFNFIKLRSGEHALAEIRDYSERIEEIIAETVPISYDAFNKHGRIVP